MKWYINKSNPICPQICEQICVGIASNEFLPNQKIYSVRELALLIGVTPNTVQKSYEILNESGVIYSVKGSGWYVGENIELAQKTVDSLKKKKTDVYLLEMQQIGYDEEKTMEYLKERLGEH